jgi:hypothetical protein
MKENLPLQADDRSNNQETIFSHFTKPEVLARERH